MAASPTRLAAVGLLVAAAWLPPRPCASPLADPRPASTPATRLPAETPSGPLAADPDSTESRVRALLSADSLDLDRLEILLRADTLAEDSLAPRPGIAPVAPSAPAPPPVGAPGAAPGDGTSPPRDLRTVRWELGAGTDLLNEQYYEYRDALFDTTTLNLRSAPETRVAGVGAFTLEGTRAAGAVRYRVRDDLSVGNLLQRNTLDALWRDVSHPRWTLVLAPRLEYRHDRTFDRDLTEWRATAAARARRELGGPDTGLELGGRGEVLRATGPGTDFLLDRVAGTATIAIDRAPLFGSEMRLGYAFTVREFPDSSVRDHLEHGWEARWRTLGGGGWLGVESDGERRSTLELAPTTRDNYWRGRVAVLGGLIAGETWEVEARAEGEALSFDAPDSLSWFDERILRVSIEPWRRLTRGVRMTLGPRVERLWTPRQPGERYREFAAAAGVEGLADGAWWSVAPSAGRRDYDQEALGRAAGAGGLHTSYTFLELGLIADQPLPVRLLRRVDGVRGMLRLRGFANARAEFHRESADDARSLYISLDVRMLF